jgi:hypothetical protein
MIVITNSVKMNECVLHSKAQEREIDEEAAKVV